MTGTSLARTDNKSGKNKNLPVTNVKVEFGTSSQARDTMFGQEETMRIQHGILKENHEILEKNYQSLQERMKHVEEAYEMMKRHLESRTEELEVTNKRLLEDCKRERSEKEKLFEEMKAMESQRKATVDELMMKNQELEKMEKNKYAELEKKFVMVEKEYSYLKSLYDAEDDEVVASDAIVSGDESDAENEQTKKRCVEDNTQQVGGSMASKKQKTQDTPLSNSYAFSYEYNKDGPFVDDKDACADLQRLVKDIPYDFPLVHELEESEAYKDMAHAIAQMTAKANSVIWLYDRRLKMALGIRTEWSEDEFLTDLLEEEAVLDKSRAWTKVICSTNRIVWWYDRKLKAAQGVKKELSRVRENLRVEKRKSLLRKKSVKELSKKSEALQAENFQFATELIGSKETVAALKAEKARLVDKLVSNVRKSMDSLTSQIEGSK